MPIKIIIPYGEKEIRVTPQEARELMNALEEIQDEFAVQAEGLPLLTEEQREVLTRPRDTDTLPWKPYSPYVPTCTCHTNTGGYASCPLHGYSIKWSGTWI